jgi:hypothetical protein
MLIFNESWIIDPFQQKKIVTKKNFVILGFNHKI